MRILSAIQSIFAAAFILFGLVVLFGIGITGLLFLVPGAVFAATAAVTQEQSRAAIAVALAVDAVLAHMSAHKLEGLLGSGTTGVNLHQTVSVLGHPNLIDYLIPSAALVLVGIAVVSVVMDWRALRNSPWF